MAVLIKNMEMPESCGTCKLFFGGYCKAGKTPKKVETHTDNIGRMDDCPLVEIPSNTRIG